MKKLSCFLIPCLVFCFYACASLPQLVKEPHVSLNSVDFAGISLQGVDLLVHVDVENPNGITIPLPKLDWELFINDASFLKGAINNNQSLTAHQTVTIDLPLSVGYEGLFNAFSSIINSNETAYEITVALTFNIPVLGERVYRLTHSGTLPIIRKPEISFQGITRKSLGPTMEFVLTWEIENRNNFDFTL